MSLEDWTRGSFTAAGITHDTYRRGTGPGVVVVHEIPGITPAVLAFAEEVVADGFTVVMPDLVGTPGRPHSPPYVPSSVVRVCISREFTTWATNRTSPVIGYLRALARSLHLELGGPGVGAVGMCFSGGFALAMMVDDTVVAPVLSQPSLPFAVGKARGANLGLSPDDALVVAERAAAGCPVLGLKFTEDKLVGSRFETLHTLLGGAFRPDPYPSAKRSDHSVLTEQRQEQAVQRVLAFFHERLDDQASPRA